MPSTPTDPWVDVAAALAATGPADKCRRVAGIWSRVESGDWPPGSPFNFEIPLCGRPDRPELVAPRDLARRGLGTDIGRAALVHAIAHIEFNAINLALDAALRFTGLPEDYYLDWLSVAADEARHYGMLAERLVELGHAYGDFSAHNGLWAMAERTAHDPLIRMALVPRVLEARGLDVTPGMIERLRAAGDARTVACLEIILEEEERHVAIGSRWFRFLCEQRGVDPESTFMRLFEEYFAGQLRGPLNTAARERAGFSGAEIERLAKLAGDDCRKR